MSEAEKKGLTVKIDADLHAQIRQYIEANSMTMTEFVSKALDDELHPKIDLKEGNNMEATRTLAFQISEEMYWEIKDYIARHGITQKKFMTDLIQAELDRDLEERQALSETRRPSDDEPYEDESEELGNYENDELSEDDEELDEYENEDLYESEDMDDSEDEAMSMGM